MVKWWKHSKLRFYWCNTRWNYQFWLHAKPIYREHKYTVDEGLDLDQTLSDAVMKVKVKRTTKTQRRFIGFFIKTKSIKTTLGFKVKTQRLGTLGFKKGWLKRNFFGLHTYINKIDLCLIQHSHLLRATTLRNIK